MLIAALSHSVSVAANLGKLENLYYKTGHGHLVRAMCAGPAKITADIINNQIPEISLLGFTVEKA